MIPEPILVIAPHTDDETLGCGGTIAKISKTFQAFSYCHVIAFSTGHPSIGSNEDEFRNAMLELHLGVTTIELLDYPDRNYNSRRQNILDYLVSSRKEIAPKTVFCPSIKDIHQDHLCIAQECIRAFRRECNVLAYETPSTHGFTPNFFVELEEEDVRCKLAALKCYVSQKDKFYFGEEFVRGLLRFRAKSIGGGLAEGFEVVKWLE